MTQEANNPMARALASWAASEIIQGRWPETLTECTLYRDELGQWVAANEKQFCEWVVDVLVSHANRESEENRIRYGGSGWN